MSFKASLRIGLVSYLGGLWIMWNLNVVVVSMLQFSTQLNQYLIRTNDGRFEAVMTFRGVKRIDSP